MTINSEKDLEGLKRIGKIVAQTLAEMQKVASVGMTTLELDEIGKKMLEKHGARSAPILMYKFPGHTCISINDEIAHGIPSNRVIKAGDMINIDVSAELDGYVADTGGTIVIPPTNVEKQRLCQATKTALKNAISVATAGRELNLIGKEIEKVANQTGFKTIKNLGSHGVGHRLHEDPGFIPGYYEPRDKRKFLEGMVITIEPFLSTNVEFATESSDGWTLKGTEGNLSAQYEHTLVITRDKPILVTVA